MATYTTQVRSICEVKAGKTERAGFTEVEEILANSWNKIFNNEWTTFDPNYKSVLCCKILRHYYTREICAETVGLWLLWLNSRMCEIMPYYNDLYKSASLEYNPLTDTDYTTTRTGGDTATNSGGLHTDSTDTRTDNLHERQNDSHLNLYNDTPQGGLSDLEDLSYLTDARKIYGTNARDNTGTQTNKTLGDVTDSRSVTTSVDYTETFVGKRGGQTYSKMIEEYRNTLINIDNMIIKELKDLFFNIY